MPSLPTNVERRVPLSRILKWTGTSIIAIPLVAFFVLRGSVASDIKRLRQRSLDRGEPQTMVEIMAEFSDVKPEENAAEAILDLWTEEEGSHWTEWRKTGSFQSSRKTTVVDPQIPFLGETLNTSIPWPE